MLNPLACIYYQQGIVDGCASKPALTLGAAEDKLVTFYILKIRSIVMFGAVCFHSSLSADLSQTLELQQKRCFAIILGSRYKNYSNARLLLDLPRLDFLREKACLKWALKTIYFLST